MTTGAAANTVIVQISDTHITAGGDLHDTVDSLDNLAEILTAIEAAGEPPALLLFTGDLADKGEPDAYRRFRTTVEPFAARMGVPALYVPGNHDERSAFRKHLLDWEDGDGDLDQVVVVDGLRVVALDSSVPGEPHGELGEDQLAWLARELETPAERGTILAIHHPPILSPSAFLNTLILRDPERLGEVVAGSDVLMIVAGHAHHASAGIFAGIPVWVATASAYQMDVLAAASTALRGIPGSAFTRIDVTPAGAVATHVPMLPGERSLYEIDFATIEKMIRGDLTAEEIAHAFAHETVGS
jgi:3',5'-cyclic AMP phosphodiesterase CpdA